MKQYFTFYTVTEQSDHNENITSWFSSKSAAQKHCNEVNKLLKEEYCNDGLWTDELLLEVDTLEVPKGKKELLGWFNNYAHNI